MTKRFELRLCSNGTYYVYENGTLTDIDFDKFNKESAYALIDEVNALYDENEQLKTENTMLKEHQNINCQNCQYFVSDSVSSDCLKREDIGYKGTCIDGMDLHMLAKNCPYY